MKTAVLTLLCTAALAYQTASALAQTVEGKVTLPAAAYERMTSQHYQGKSDTPIAAPEPPTAIVYLEGVFPETRKPTANSFAEMAQKNIGFAPGILAIQSGTTVEFPNLDDTYHNVFSYSKTKRFDLGRYRKGEKPGDILFDKPGVVTLHCEIHGAMRGTILVLDTPYFKRTDAQGAYRLGPLPSGHYLLKAWIGENDVRVRPVDLKAGTTLHVDFP